MVNDVSTIAALATAPAPAGIAVIRVSGPLTRKALNHLFHAKSPPVDNPRMLCYGKLVDFQTGNVIDKSLAVFMPAPNSYTGEDVAEIQLHGSLLLVQKVLRSLYSFGISPAEAGEFSKRAFLNGKLDLVQVEAIRDMIQATTDKALLVASEQLEGRFSKAIESFGDPLRDSLAEIEAHLDFPEEDINPESFKKISSSIKKARKQIQKLIFTYSYGQIVKDGFRVLLCGRPNAGKSSILNLLLGHDRAIVTEVPGTTRDLIEEEATFSGYKFVFCDSAGITQTSDVVEKIGVELAYEKLKWADLVLMVVDSTESMEDSMKTWMPILEDIKSKSHKIWLVFNKIDLAPDAISKFAYESKSADQIFYLSAKTHNGLETLITSLVEEIQSRIADSSEGNTIITNERHRTCLMRAEEALTRAVDVLKQNEPLELCSAELRLAFSALEEIIGKTWTEDILGRIFSKFCIGK
ncbi:MAG: tRNA uridine-5-carboxymethylaminomethyl(34) synthesis GTPase MnmE [bacterium]|nr:tRNA uridine-5-carboxymethylaminomethyl(34) synthesis GTPase MnmE [bacterium]